MSGSKVGYQGAIGMNVTELFGIQMASIGMIHADNKSRELVFSDPAKPAYKKVVLKDGRIQGAIFLGDISSVGLFHRIIKTRSRIAEDNAKKLMTLPRDIPIAPILSKYNEMSHFFARPSSPMIRGCVTS